MAKGFGEIFTPGKRSHLYYRNTWKVNNYSDGCTFALDPAANTWTDLQAKNYPGTCRTVAWAAMCYDPLNDQILLFGGGLATNPAGGAPTWLYDCAENIWRRPKLKAEPPLRCNSPIVYDPATQSMIMFGGYDQAAALNDTWAFDCRTGRWRQRDQYDTITFVEVGKELRK